MGLFSNFERPGPGVNKNAPRAKGLKLFFELYFRKFGSYLQLNLFYFTSLIPAIAVVWYFIISIFNDFALLNNDTLIAATILSLLISVILCCVFALSPFSSGFHYVLRNFSFEKHAFVFSDFIDKFRENAKNSIIMFFIDLIAVIAGILFLRIYLILSMSNSFFIAPFTFLIIAMIVYSLMTPYRWTMLITFDLNKRQIYKNALFFVLGDLKVSLKHLISTSLFVILLFVLVYLTSVVGIILLILCAFSAYGLISQINIYQQMQDFISQSPGGHENIN